MPPAWLSSPFSRKKTPLRAWLQQRWFNVSRIWRTLLQTLFRRYTIYVLECENGKYYVGSTSKLRKRWRQHSRGRGAAWTRRHRPIRQVFTYRRVPEPYYLGLESKITAEWMLKYGVNNVRGAMFAETRPYTLVRTTDDCR
jgi:predicted GIY-YIG superfamily endonuclease